MTAYGAGAYGTGVYGASVVAADPVVPGGKIGPGVGDLLITDIGGGNPHTLLANGVACSWAVKGAGSLSAELMTRDLIERWGRVDLRSKWLRWRHPDLGVWGGEIGDCQVDLTTETTEIAAATFEALLAARQLARAYEIPRGAMAGDLAVRIIADAGRADGHTWIEDVIADSAGEALRWSSGGGSLLEALDDLASQSGQEYWVDPETRILYWRARIGRDLTPTVCLVEGRDIVGGQVTFALEPVVTELTAIPAAEPYAVSQAFTVRHEAGIINYGVRQADQVYPQGVSKSVLRSIAKADLASRVTRGQAASLDIINAGGMFAQFREGDTVGLLLPSINARVSFRPMVRSYDTTSNTLSIAGDVTP